MATMGFLPVLWLRWMEQGEGYLANHLESDFLNSVERGAKDIEHLLFQVKRAPSVRGI
jgi:hypothetical protein